MSKELNTHDQSIAIVEVASDTPIQLDDISLALVGGGELPVSL